VLYTFRMDSFACGTHRVMWPADVIDPEGTRIKHIAPNETDGVVTARVLGSRVTGLTNVPSDMTAILIQRPTNIMLGQCIPWLRAEGIRVIIDVDDDLELLSARHPSWELLHNEQGHDAKVVRQACKHADVVVCSTPQIKERLAPINGVVVRNRLPAHHFDVLPDEEFMALNPYTFDPHVAWPVSIGTHPDDGQETSYALTRMGVPVRVVGPRSPRGKSIFGVEPHFDGEVKFDNWMSRVATIHTGIAPLNSTPFSLAKSALKPLELAVANVPFVRSRTPEFELLGAGLGAGNKREWYYQLKRLMAEDVLRKEEIARNQEIAQANRYDDPEIRAEWEHAWFDFSI
jgi:hypothetical protein